MSLLALLHIQLLLLRALSPNRREIKRLAPSTLQPHPHAIVFPVIPQQHTHPRLHVPTQLQNRIRPVLQLSADVGDLVFRALAIDLDDAGGHVRFCLVELVVLGLLGALGRGVDVVVLIPGGGGAGEDGVPDYGFGGGFGGFGGGVDGFEVEEDLFGVPIEKGREI